ncbi:hypothetical protein BOW53_07150 [Solemya pervernicosa gill symbiont]|uniref:TraB/GumN family protein n=2 Tax=Gammaproteobacteria incertae sedis TaxID=118884 RepID=A0A1T2L668_9GAMM|nr:TraB/GumN family protein [Candidatus Reidiella endopervernicosa]OOZ40552.1 hypothetical protein BOW53_07150 [Solemya pervernicosa gill symbiont]QKQ27627.1 TraB/GumN family protein [Candidatus Reidiella endopervernicosa]
MLKRSYSLLILLVSLTSLVHADPALYEKGLLWQVERPGETASFVFGTIHSEDPRVIELPIFVRQSFNHSQRLIMELVPDPQAIASIAGKFQLTGGKTLEPMFDAELYRQAMTIASNFGLPEIAAKRFKPWALATTISIPKPETGLFLDNRLYLMAQRDKKPVFGLESAEEQLNIFDKLSDEDQVTLLRDSVENHPQIAAELEKMLQVYVARDLGALWEIQELAKNDGDADLNERLAKRMVDDRNRLMVTRMTPYLEQGRSFVAVGALHLPGEVGILNLLKQQGYKVSRVY